VRSPDPVALAGGVVAVVLGVLLLLEAEGTIGLSAGWLAVALCAGTGAVLVVSGLSERGGGEGDREGDGDESR
jgi:uncharacterized membrane protein